MAFSVQGKTAIVTGAALVSNLLHYCILCYTCNKSNVQKWIMTDHMWKLIGIDFCFATLLLENGCNCLIADLGLRPEAQALIEKYAAKSEHGGRAAFQKTDVTDWNQLEEMFVVAERTFGEIDIVCPGAGVYEPVRPDRTKTLKFYNNTVTALVEFLQSTGREGEQRLSFWWPICYHGHQSCSPYPHNANCYITHSRS